MRLFSRWPGRDSEARQPRSKGGPEELRQHDESKGHSTRTPEGEPLNTQTWNTPKPLRPGQGQVGSVQRDWSTRPDVRRRPASPTWRSEEPESHPRKGGNWIGNPEPKAPREKRKRPGERESRDFRTRTSRIANQPRKVETDTLPQRQGYTMVRGRDVARSNARTAMPASETTTLPPGEERRRTWGTLQRDQPLETERQTPRRAASKPTKRGKPRKASRRWTTTPARPPKQTQPQMGVNGNRARRRSAKTHFSVG